MISMNEAESAVATRLSCLFSGERLDDCKSKSQDFAHQVLRLVFCQEREEQKRWFVNAETRLFLQLASDSDRQSMLSCVPRRMIEECTQDEEKSEGAIPTRIQLETLAKAFPRQSSDSEKEREFYYLVNFERVPERLLGNRLVVLSRGTAFVPSRYEEELCRYEFQDTLKRNLALAYKIRGHILKRDERVAELCNRARSYFQKRFRYIHTSATESLVTTINATARQNVARQNIDLYAKRSMPLCMASLFEELHRASHLKYDGRYQLQGFLKGIGFTLQDSLVYWRQAFSKKFTPRDFESKYAYSIRHYYGKVGKRYDRPPLDCDKILTKLPAPGVGQFHGCPFKYWGESALRSHFRSRGIPSQDVKRIMNFVEKENYRASCKEYFEATHEGFTIQSLLDETDSDGGVTPSEHHPNLYFEASEIFWGVQENSHNNDQDW